MEAPRGGPRREKGARGVEWGGGQTHSFIHSALDCGASTGSVQKDPGFGPDLGALGFEEAQRCWLGRKGSGWSKVPTFPVLCSAAEPRKTGVRRVGVGLVVQPGRTS